MATMITKQSKKRTKGDKKRSVPSAVESVESLNQPSKKKKKENTNPSGTSVRPSSSNNSSRGVAKTKHSETIPKKKPSSKTSKSVSKDPSRANSKQNQNIANVGEKVSTSKSIERVKGSVGKDVSNQSGTITTETPSLGFPSVVNAGDVFRHAQDNSLTHVQLNNNSFAKTIKDQLWTKVKFITNITSRMQYNGKICNKVCKYNNVPLEKREKWWTENHKQVLDLLGRRRNDAMNLMRRRFRGNY